MSAILWREYTLDHATIPVLVRRYGLSEKTIRTKLHAYTPPKHTPVPRTMVAIGDATYCGPHSWMLVIRDPHAHENVYMKELYSETSSAYQESYRTLTEDGFTITAFVGDGRVATPWLFPGIPIQMCHFHMEAIIVRYTTRNPHLEAGKDLLALAGTLSTNDGDSFADAFKLWCRTWEEFLKEKTIDPKTGRSSWTHKRLRQARDSMKAHLPYLYTFEKYPELNIPNTTNSLDGSFKKVKLAIGVHSGLPHARKIKLITSLLNKSV